MRKRNDTEDSAEYAASQLLTFRDGIGKGDMVFAYECRNIVALTGTVTFGYAFNRENDVGDPDGPVRYGHQVNVDWWARPRYFHRTNFYHTSLPELVDWVKLRGTIYSADYADSVITRLGDELQEIPNGAGRVPTPKTRRPEIP